MLKQLLKFAATALLVMTLVLPFTACSAPAPETPTPTTPAPTTTPAPGTGRVVFYVTDAAADMGTVSSVQITVDSLRVQSQGSGWTTVSTTAQTYDLLKLKATGTGELLAQVDLKAGTYDQFELNISKVVVVDAEGSHEAKLPSGSLHIKASLEVKEGTTATANFDFIADESLHLTGEGKYILGPVIQVETRDNAQVEVTANKGVRVSGGKAVAQVKVGMDSEGKVDVGLKIGPDIILSIDRSGKIIEVKGQGTATGTLKSVDTSAGTITITTAGGTDIVLNVVSNTRIEVKGAVSTLLSLVAAIGSKVSVKYDATTNVAMSINTQ